MKKIAVVCALTLLAGCGLLGGSGKPAEIRPSCEETAKQHIVVTCPMAGNKVALTFDDRIADADIDKALGTLKDKKVKGTFFLNCNWVDTHQAVVKRIQAEGHLIGNHGYDHKDFSSLVRTKQREQIGRCHESFKKIGIDDRPYFRFPFGELDTQALLVLREMGYIGFAWDISSGGLKNTKERVVNRVVIAAEPGSIILMHLHDSSDLAALPDIIDGLRKKGLEPVRLDEMMKAKG